MCFKKKNQNLKTAEIVRSFSHTLEIYDIIVFILHKNFDNKSKNSKQLFNKLQTLLLPKV